LTVAKIDRIQYFLTIPNLIFGKAIGITAGIMVRIIGSDIWVSMLIGFVMGIAAMLLMTFLCSRFPDKTIIQFSEEILGKWLGRGLGIILLLFFIMLYGASANVLTLHVKEYFLPETPFILICLLYTLICMYGAFLGLEAIVRFSFIGFIMLLLISIAMITGTMGDLNPINLFPLMDKGIVANISTSLYAFGDIAMAVFAVGFLFPMVNNKKNAFSITFWAMLVGTLMVIIWPMFEIMVMGPNLMKQYCIVCMQQIRIAQLTNYFPRYELLMVSFFTFGVFVQSSIMFYLAQYSIKQVTGIKKDWIIIVPLTVIIVYITYRMGIDENEYINFLSYPYSQICAILTICLPITLLLTALIRGKLKKEQKYS
jgi:spore germination protein KB